MRRGGRGQDESSAGTGHSPGLGLGYLGPAAVCLAWTPTLTQPQGQGTPGLQPQCLPGHCSAGCKRRARPTASELPAPPTWPSGHQGVPGMGMAPPWAPLVVSGDSNSLRLDVDQTRGEPQGRRGPPCPSVTRLTQCLGRGQSVTHGDSPQGSSRAGGSAPWSQLRASPPAGASRLPRPQFPQPPTVPLAPRPTQGHRLPCPHSGLTGRSTRFSTSAVRGAAQGKGARAG